MQKEPRFEVIPSCFREACAIAKALATCDQRSKEGSFSATADFSAMLRNDINDE